tara:strand:+ start:87 stop:476 length:390 start_codon:yes stop_codon:yes gene_type:complete
MRYGRRNCEHEFRNRIHGYEEGCGPVICIRCGGFACLCDVRKQNNNYSDSRVDLGLDDLPGYYADDNLNGRWLNPYIPPGSLPRALRVTARKKKGLAIRRSDDRNAEVLDRCYRLEHKAQTPGLTRVET